MAEPTQTAKPPGVSPSSVVEESHSTSARTLTPDITDTRRRFRKRLVLYSVLAVLLGVSIPYGVRLWRYYQTHESTDDAYIVGDIVPVSARVNGTVLSVHVEDHQMVEAGQLLVRLDPQDFELQLQQAEAAVAVATARWRQAEIEVPLVQEITSSDTARTSATVQAAQSALRVAQHRTEEAQALLHTREAAVAAARAEVDMQQARLDTAQAAFKRMQPLLADGVVAQQQFDEADGAWRTAQAEWRASQQRLVQAQSEVERARVEVRTQHQAAEQAQAHVAEAQAMLAGSHANRQNVDMKQAQVQVMRAVLQQAQAELDYTRQQLTYTALHAPVAGVIAKKNVEIGQVMQTGRPVLAIVPLHDVWVEANFKETQLQALRPGQKATLHVDTYPNTEFTGTVESVSPGTGSVFSLLPPENATGNFVKVVQRVPVKIVLDAETDPQHVLRPGMSVVATVTIR
jgi:membrane fusion protein (multidrug efflux system)